jgi:hypothetical protein
MAYTNVHTSTGTAKINVSTVNLQVRSQRSLPVIKEERSASNGPWIINLLRGGVSMIATIISALILLVMSVVFKWINAKQSEFDKFETEHR